MTGVRVSRGVKAKQRCLIGVIDSANVLCLFTDGQRHSRKSDFQLESVDVSCGQCDARLRP